MYPELFVSYMGIVAGAIIYKLTKEEVDEYVEYIIAIKRITLLSFFFISLYFLEGYKVLLTLLILIIVLFAETKLYSWRREIVIYVSLTGLILASDLRIVYLLFIYGIFAGSLLRKYLTNREALTG